MLTKHPHPIKSIDTAPKPYVSARLAEVWLTRQCQRASRMIVPPKNTSGGIFFAIPFGSNIRAIWSIDDNGYGVVDIERRVYGEKWQWESYYANPRPRYFAGLSITTAMHILAHNQPEHVKAEALRVFDWVITEANVGGIKPYTFAVYEAAKPASFYDWFNFYMQEGNYAIARRMIEGLQLAYPYDIVANNLIDNVPSLSRIHADTLDWWVGFSSCKLRLERAFTAVYGTGAAWLWSMMAEHWYDALDWEVVEYD